MSGLIEKTQHEIEKNYYEHLARGVLGHFISSQFDKFEKFEDPDFRFGDSYGFEVTRAFFDGAGKASGDFEKMQMKHISEVPEKDSNKLRKNGFKICEHNGVIFGYLPPVQWFSLDEIKNCFNAKLRKIENYHTKIVDLFVVSPLFNYYDFEDIDTYCKWCQQTQKQQERKFNKVYIFDYTSLFICNLESGETERIHCSNDAVQKCCENAKAIAEQLSHT